MSNVLIEELGPRGKRRVQIGTWVALALSVLLLVAVLLKLQSGGQLAPERWADLFAPSMLEFLGAGLLSTVQAALIAGVLAIVVGFGLALMRLSQSSIARGVAVGWVELFRALPLLLLIIAVFSFDTALAAGGSSLLGVLGSLVVALVLYNSAVLSEIFRSGVLSLDRGQTEAAQSVGMSYWQTMFLVVLPQAVRRMIPAIVAQMATLTKDVSLGYVIGYAEFVRRGARASQQPGTEVTDFQAYVFVGIVYFMLIWALAKLADKAEKWQRKQPTLAPVDPDAEDAMEVAEEAAAG